MPALENPKQEGFANDCASGKSAAEAYMIHWPDSSAKSAETNGPAMARRNQVAIRIAELRGMAQTLADEKAQNTVLTILEKREYIARVIRAKPSQAGMENPDCELVMTKMGPAALFPSKASLLKLDNELSEDTPEQKVSVAIPGLADAVKQVFGK